VLDAQVAEHSVTVDALRPHLRDGFPWHRPDVAHPELGEPDNWWRSLGKLIDRAYTAVGVEERRLEELRSAVREHYCDATKFSLYPDTAAALELVRSIGARTVILSNHVPELASIVDLLGIGHIVDRVLTSALTGVEKPNPRTYRQALEGNVPPGNAWMIGDNPFTDKQGAIEAGMNAALVRHPKADFPDVLTAVRGGVPPLV
jgi:putative hydrolase of the HAD superfamily